MAVAPLVGAQQLEVPRRLSPAPIRRGEGAPCPLRRKNVACVAVCRTHSGAATRAWPHSVGNERDVPVVTLRDGCWMLGLNGQHAKALGELTFRALVLRDNFLEQLQQNRL